MLLETARAVLYRHAHELETGALYTDLPVQEGMAKAVLTKYVATNNACAIVDRALHVVGGAGYFRRFPLERMYRDVRAGPIMPYNNLEARDLFGRTSLGIEVAPAVRCPTRSAWASAPCDDRSGLARIVSKRRTMSNPRRGT